MVVMAVRGCRQILEHFMIWNFGQMGFFWGCWLHFSRSQYFLDSHRKDNLIKALMLQWNVTL